MTARRIIGRRRDQHGGFSIQPDDLEKRLNKIVEKSVTALAEKAKALVEKNASERRKLTHSA
jgi:hypothetical protein